MAMAFQFAGLGSLRWPRLVEIREFKVSEDVLHEVHLSAQPKNHEELVVHFLFLDSLVPQRESHNIDMHTYIMCIYNYISICIIMYIYNYIYVYNYVYI